MKIVSSQVDLSDDRGNIKKGNKGKVTSMIPHSSGKIPVWFFKHGKNPFYWYPVWMDPADIKEVITDYDKELQDQISILWDKISPIGKTAIENILNDWDLKLRKDHPGSGLEVTQKKYMKLALMEMYIGNHPGNFDPLGIMYNRCFKCETEKIPTSSAYCNTCLAAEEHF